MVYSLSRMKDLIILNEFSFIEDFEKHIHIDPNIGIWNNDVEPIKIELLFSKEINTNILERTWHKDQECKQNDDGSVYQKNGQKKLHQSFQLLTNIFTFFF